MPGCGACPVHTSRAMTTTRAPEQTEERAVTPRGWTGEKGPASWGLGDGQAIPWEYASAPEARDLARIRPEYGLFINGREVPATGGETFVDIDPSTEQPLAQIAKATPKDVDRAVRAARQAFERRWGNLPAASAPNTCSGSRGSSRSAAASSPSSSRSTRGSRSGSRVTSTCRSPRRTSGTTPAGPTSSSTRSRAATRARWVWPARSSRGTSRC